MRNYRPYLAAHRLANDLWVSYWKLVDHCEKFCQKAEALELMEQSLRISERLAATDSTNVEWQQDVRADRSLVAELRAKVGK